jgi:hypothetical protein
LFVSLAGVKRVITSSSIDMFESSDYLIEQSKNPDKQFSRVSSFPNLIFGFSFAARALARARVDDQPNVRRANFLLDLLRILDLRILDLLDIDLLPIDLLRDLLHDLLHIDPLHDLVHIDPLHLLDLSHILLDLSHIGLVEHRDQEETL